MEISMTDTSAYCVIGKFGAPYGVRGELKVHSFTDPYEGIMDYPNLYLKVHDHWEPMPAYVLRLSGNSLLLKFDDYHDRDIVRRFVNQEIAVLRSDLPAPEENEFYWTDLEGLDVMVAQGSSPIEGQLLGQVFQVFNAGASDILDVRGGPKDTLIPFIPSVIVNVDLSARTIWVDWDPDF
jgi:16S rRNA processing protein RimM